MFRSPIPLSDRRTQPRVGVVGEFFEEMTEETAWGYHTKLIDDLGQSGVEVVELDLPHVFRFGLPAIWTIMRAELASVHEPLYPAHKNSYGPSVRALVESGLLLDSNDYLRARRIRRAYQRDMQRLFSDCDVILSPGAPGPAPAGLASTGAPLLQAPWTLADFPTVSLPLGLTPSGLPIGIQLTAPPLGEGALFDVSRWMEEFIGFSAAPLGI
jgi:Asp-tRNA(Asn)/Glu-tRNA(Gln) amidotransferase A subunit family amidase